MNKYDLFIQRNLDVEKWVVLVQLCQVIDNRPIDFPTMTANVEYKDDRTYKCTIHCKNMDTITVTHEFDGYHVKYGKEDMNFASLWESIIVPYIGKAVYDVVK